MRAIIPCVAIEFAISLWCQATLVLAGSIRIPRMPAPREARAAEEPAVLAAPLHELSAAPRFQLIRVENSYARRYRRVKEILVAYFEGI